MKKLKRYCRTKREVTEYIRIKTELRKLLVNNTILEHKEQVIADIAKNNKRARRLIKRFKTEDAGGAE